MRVGVIEVGATDLRAVVVEPVAGGHGTVAEFATRRAVQGWSEPAHRVVADERIVLGLHRAVARDGELGPGLAELVVETGRRLRASVARAGADQVEAVITARLAGAGDLPTWRAGLRRALACDVDVLDAEAEAVLLANGVAAAVSASTTTPADEVRAGVVGGRDRLIVEVGAADVRAVAVR